MQIAPSILSVLNKDLTSILNKVESSGIKYIHLDVMDNIFVPNKTFDDCLIKNLRKKSNLIFDTHLMIEKPELFVENYRCRIRYHYFSFRGHNLTKFCN